MTCTSEAEPSRRKPPSVVSSRYARLARAGTRPEIVLRKRLHALGCRFRVQFKVEGLPRRKVDIAFPKRRLAVFVDGCFWHGCPDHGTRPKTNEEWWEWKLKRNRSRDEDTNERLAELGWRVVRVWEHEDPDLAAAKVIAALEEPSPRVQSGASGPGASRTPAAD